MYKPLKQPVYVTQPIFPDLTKLGERLKDIWASKQLSNQGPVVRTLESELSDFLGAKYLSVFTNGTLALQLACKALNLTGEVITTPFTFAATIHVLDWCNLKPVFCDIDEATMNINPDHIERLITPSTSAIMPVHVFGNPCDVEKIQSIADKHGIKVIYDAAHAFGVKVNGTPIANFGDITMFSFHATKVYHTIEGGGLSFNNAELMQRANLLRNFGLMSDGDVYVSGTNAKLNEIQAAVGLLVLEEVELEIQRRKAVTNLYRGCLKNVSGITLNQDMEGVEHNYPYLVIRVNKEQFGMSRDDLYQKLVDNNVFPRKYFYPLCSNFKCYEAIESASKKRLPIANRVADSVLALPLYGQLEPSIVERICDIIKG